MLPTHWQLGPKMVSLSSLRWWVMIVVSLLCSAAGPGVVTPFSTAEQHTAGAGMAPARTQLAAPLPMLRLDMSQKRPQPVTLKAIEDTDHSGRTTSPSLKATQTTTPITTRTTITRTTKQRSAATPVWTLQKELEQVNSDMIYLSMMAREGGCSMMTPPLANATTVFAPPQTAAQTKRKDQHGGGTDQAKDDEREGGGQGSLPSTNVSSSASSSATSCFVLRPAEMLPLSELPLWRARAFSLMPAAVDITLDTFWSLLHRNSLAHRITVTHLKEAIRRYDPFRQPQSIFQQAKGLFRRRKTLGEALLDVFPNLPAQLIALLDHDGNGSVSKGEARARLHELITTPVYYAPQLCARQWRQIQRFDLVKRKALQEKIWLATYACWSGISAMASYATPVCLSHARFRDEAVTCLNNIEHDMATVLRNLNVPPTWHRHELATQHAPYIRQRLDRIRIIKQLKLGGAVAALMLLLSTPFSFSPLPLVLSSQPWAAAGLAGADLLFMLQTFHKSVQQRRNLLIHLPWWYPGDEPEPSCKVYLYQASKQRISDEEMRTIEWENINHYTYHNSVRRQVCNGGVLFRHDCSRRWLDNSYFCTFICIRIRVDGCKVTLPEEKPSSTASAVALPSGQGKEEEEEEQEKPTQPVMKWDPIDYYHSLVSDERPSLDRMMMTYDRDISQPQQCIDACLQHYACTAFDISVGFRPPHLVRCHLHLHSAVQLRPVDYTAHGNATHLVVGAVKSDAQIRLM